MYIYIYIYICIYILSSKIYSHYMNFSLNTFLLSISGLAFAFTKVRILLLVPKLTSSTRFEEAAKNDIRMLRCKS